MGEHPYTSPLAPSPSPSLTAPLLSLPLYLPLSLPPTTRSPPSPLYLPSPPPATISTSPPPIFPLLPLLYLSFSLVYIKLVGYIMYIDLSKNKHFCLVISHINLVVFPVRNRSPDNSLENATFERVLIIDIMEE